MDETVSTALGLGILIILGVFTFYVFKTYFAPKKLDQLADMISAGHYGLAIKKLKNLIEENDRNADAHFLLGDAYQRQKKYLEAIVEYKKVLRLGRFSNHLKEEMVRSRLGKLHLQLNNLNEAKKEFLILTKLDPTNSDNFYQVGILFESAEIFDKALSYFKQAIKVNPAHANALLHKGIIYFQQGNMLEARNALIHAVRLNPNLYDGHYYLGLCLKNQKDYEWAIKEFDMALASNQSKGKIYLAKGLCYLERNIYPKAIIEFEHGLGKTQKGSETDLNLHYFIALASEKIRDIHTAIKHWEIILDINPKFRDVSEKIKNYEEFKTEDAIKDFLIAPLGKFEIMCKGLIKSLDMDILDFNVKNDSEVHAVGTESETKWHNTKLSNRLIYIFRVTDPIPEQVLRYMHEEMRKTNAIKGVCLATSTFTSQAEAFCQSRPIELVDKTGMIRHLQNLSVT